MFIVRQDATKIIAMVGTRARRIPLALFMTGMVDRLRCGRRLGERLNVFGRPGVYDLSGDYVMVTFVRAQVGVREDIF
jgi:hypothetical protein